MDSMLSHLLVLLLFTDLLLLGTSRIRVSIRVVAAQGIVLGLLPFLLHFSDGISPSVIATAGLGLALRGVVFPWLLFRAMRAAGVGLAATPTISYSTAMFLGVLFTGYAFWLWSRLPLPVPPESPLVLPVALSTQFVGLLLVITRRKALSQVLGYIVLENGIFLLSVGLKIKEDLLVELGILLDLFVALFIMGILVYHIRREFDRIDVDQLTSLRG
ncbi:MAG TPA: NADH-quinone oxidoreductase subunit K [bacterium]|jgi:hydrogenase-4 component E